MIERTGATRISWVMVIAISVHSVAECRADFGDERVAEQADERADQVEHRLMGQRAGDCLVETEPGLERIAKRELGAGQQREADVVAAPPQRDPLGLARPFAEIVEVATLLVRR